MTSGIAFKASIPSSWRIAHIRSQMASLSSLLQNLSLTAVLYAAPSLLTQIGNVPSGVAGWVRGSYPYTSSDQIFHQPHPWCSLLYMLSPFLQYGQVENFSNLLLNSSSFNSFLSSPLFHSKLPGGTKPLLQHLASGSSQQNTSFFWLTTSTFHKTLGREHKFFAKSLATMQQGPPCLQCSSNMPSLLEASSELPLMSTVSINILYICVFVFPKIWMALYTSLLFFFFLSFLQNHI